MKKVAESRQYEHSFGHGTRVHDTQVVSVGLELELDLDEHIEAAGVDERQFGAVDHQVRVVRDGVDNGQLECRYGEPVDFAAEVEQSFGHARPFRQAHERGGWPRRTGIRRRSRKRVQRAVVRGSVQKETTPAATGKCPDEMSLTTRKGQVVTFAIIGQVCDTDIGSRNRSGSSAFHRFPAFEETARAYRDEVVRRLRRVDDFQAGDTRRQVVDRTAVSIDHSHQRVPPVTSDEQHVRHPLARATSRGDCSGYSGVKDVRVREVGTRDGIRRDCGRDGGSCSLPAGSDLDMFYVVRRHLLVFEERVANVGDDGLMRVPYSQFLALQMVGRPWRRCARARMGPQVVVPDVPAHPSEHDDVGCVARLRTLRHLRRWRRLSAYLFG
jgi:hypothetical protein